MAPLTTPDHPTGIAAGSAWENVKAIELTNDGPSQRLPTSRIGSLSSDGASQQLPTSQGRTGSLASIDSSASRVSSNNDAVYAMARQPTALNFKSEVSKPGLAFGLSISPNTTTVAISDSLKDMPGRPAAVMPPSAGGVEAANLAGRSYGDPGPEETVSSRDMPGAVASLQQHEATNQASAMVPIQTGSENWETDAGAESSAAETGNPAESRLLRKDDSLLPLSTTEPAVIPSSSILTSCATPTTDAHSRPVLEVNSGTLESLACEAPIASGRAFAASGERESETAPGMVHGEKSGPLEGGVKKEATEPFTGTAIHSPELAIRPPQSAGPTARSVSEEPAKDLLQEPLEDPGTSGLLTKTAKVMAGNPQTPLADSGNLNSETPQVLTLAAAGTDGLPNVNQSPADPTRSPATEVDPQPATQNIASTQSTHRISFQLANANKNNVNVVFVEKGGKVEVAVRTPDADLARSLQSNLGDLVARLGESGLKSQVYLPANAHHFTAANPEFLSTGKNQGDPSSRNGSAGGQQQEHNGSNKRQQPRWRAQLEEMLSGEETRSDV